MQAAGKFISSCMAYEGPSWRDYSAQSASSLWILHLYTTTKPPALAPTHILDRRTPLNGVHRVAEPEARL
jgi:hypothetical protein